MNAKEQHFQPGEDIRHFQSKGKSQTSQITEKPLLKVKNTKKRVVKWLRPAPEPLYRLLTPPELKEIREIKKYVASKKRATIVNTVSLASGTSASPKAPILPSHDLADKKDEKGPT